MRDAYVDLCEDTWHSRDGIVVNQTRDYRETRLAK